jgi:hypothetical protein
MSTSYISFVCATRNDEYITNQNMKLLRSFTHLVENLDKFQIYSEIIFIEWNYIKHKPRIENILSNLKNSIYVSIKIISVGDKWHNKLKLSNKIKLATDNAVNVGIRESNSEFIIIKTQDTYYSEDFFTYLKCRKLEKNTINIIERHIVSEKDLENFLLKKFTPNSFFSRKKNKLLLPYSTKSVGDSMIMENKLWKKYRGLKESKYAINLGNDGELFYKAIGNGLKVNILDQSKNFILKPHHELMFQYAVSKNNDPSEIIKNGFSRFVHGDRVIRNDIYIGRRSFLIIKLIILRFFKYSYLFYPNNWGMKKQRIEYLKTLNNNIILYEIF